MENDSPVVTEAIAAIRRITDRANRPDYFDSIINNLQAGRSFLCAREGEGGIVFHPTERDGIPTMLIEAAWCVTFRGFSHYFAIVEDYSRDAGCEAIQFHTFRKGFDRVAPRLGFEKIRIDGPETIWRKRL